MPDMSDANIVLFEQLCEMIRHLQNLRFTAMTAFLVLSGALLTVAIRPPANAQRTTWPPGILRIAGVAVVIPFLLLEVRIFIRIWSYTDWAAQLGTHLEMHAFKLPWGTYCWSVVSLVFLLLIYVGTIIVWSVPGILRQLLRPDERNHVRSPEGSSH
jgi:hypothetical protein